MNKQVHIKIFVCIMLFCFQVTFSETKNAQYKPYFDIVKNIGTTPVEQQYRSNTCWSYAVLGMIESEILKEKNQNIQLSKMFVVYHSYMAKAEHYIRMHGKSNFTGGGALNDPLDIIAKKGIVPKEIYSGLPKGKELPDHYLLDLELKLLVDSILKCQEIKNDWKKEFTNILDKYLGTPPSNFNYQGIQYNAEDFLKSLDIHTDEYSLISSFNYKPYYSNFILEVPDNWSSAKAFNLPLDVFIKEIDNSIQLGYSVAVTLDISEQGFDFWNQGLALVSASDTLPFDNKNTIDEKKRQMAFDAFETTDDHAMLLTGIAYNKAGRKFYLAKNSWGIVNSRLQGFIYLSEEYVRYKVIAALVNRTYLDPDIQKMLVPCLK